MLRSATLRSGLKIPARGLNVCGVEEKDEEGEVGVFQHVAGLQLIRSNEKISRVSGNRTGSRVILPAPKRTG